VSICIVVECVGRHRLHSFSLLNGLSLDLELLDIIALLLDFIGGLLIHFALPVGHEHLAHFFAFLLEVLLQFLIGLGALLLGFRDVRLGLRRIFLLVRIIVATARVGVIFLSLGRLGLLLLGRRRGGGLVFLGRRIIVAALIDNDLLALEHADLLLTFGHVTLLLAVNEWRQMSRRRNARLVSRSRQQMNVVDAVSDILWLHVLALLELHGRRKRSVHDDVSDLSALWHIVLSRVELAAEA